MKKESFVIRQAISCDVCGTEMLSANHWFIAREHGTELRISLWNNQARLGSAVQHLCGHKCLHKLLDDFLISRTQASPSENCVNTSRKSKPEPAGTSLNLPNASQAARLPGVGSCVVEPESSGHLLAARQPFAERISPHRLRAEAWKREIERERRDQAVGTRSVAHGAISIINAFVKPSQQSE